MNKSQFLNQEDFLRWQYEKLKSLCFNAMSPEMSLAYLNMFSKLESDHIQHSGEETRTVLGLIRAPAAKGNHHAEEGGLIKHLLEMWDVHTTLIEIVPENNYVTHERVLRAILNHDLHKAWMTFRLVSGPDEPWATVYDDNQTDMLMTHDVKTMYLLQEHKIPMDAEQYNALCWAEGGFSAIRPKWCSVLAKYCYLLDEMSGNVLARIEKGTFLDHRNKV